MAWMKLDDKFHSSRKVHSIPKRHRFQAVGLWAIAGSWVAGEETDGFVPDYMIEQWAPTAATVDALVTAELWERTDGGYQFCAWLEYNPSKAQTRAEREASAARMKASRERRKAQSKANRGDSDLEQTSNRPRVGDEQRPDSRHSDHEQRSDGTDSTLESPNNARNGAGQQPAGRNVAVQHPGTLHRNTPAVLQRPDPTRPDPTPSTYSPYPSSHLARAAQTPDPEEHQPPALTHDDGTPTPAGIVRQWERAAGVVQSDSTRAGMRLAVGQCQRAGHDPQTIAQGLADWASSKMTHTNQIAGFVDRAAVRPRLAPVPTTNRHNADAWLELGAQMEAEGR